MLQAKKIVISLSSYYRLTMICLMNLTYIAIKQGSHKKSVINFCATRWTARVDTLSAFIAKYKLILEALVQIQSTEEGVIKKRHTGSTRSSVIGKNYCIPSQRQRMESAKKYWY